MKRYLDQTPHIKAARIAKTLRQVGDRDYVPDHVIQHCIKPYPGVRNGQLVKWVDNKIPEDPS